MRPLLRIGGRTKYRLRYELHLEYRGSSSDYIEEAIRSGIGSSHIKLYSVSVNEDLVIIEMGFTPEFSLEQTVRRIKMGSRNWMSKRGMDLSWTRGYFCKTI